MGTKRWADMNPEEKRRTRVYNYMRGERVRLACSLRAYSRKLEQDCDYSDFEYENSKRLYQLGGKLYGQKVC